MKRSTKAALAVGGVLALGAGVAIAAGKGVGAPGLSIQVSPTSLPHQGGTVTVTGTSTNLPEATAIELLVNGAPSGNAATGANGTFAFTYDVAANATPKAVTDTFQAQTVDGTVASNTATVTVAAATFQIGGIVTDATTGVPIAGAKVTASGGSYAGTKYATTNANGVFTFYDAGNGDYTLTAKAVNYKENSTTVTIDNASDHTVKISLVAG